MVYGPWSFEPDEDEESWQLGVSARSVNERSMIAFKLRLLISGPSPEQSSALYFADENLQRHPEARSRSEKGSARSGSRFMGMPRGSHDRTRKEVSA